MSAALIAIYGVLAYLVGLVGLVLFMLFVGDWQFAPWRINAHEPGPIVSALLINAGLMLLFGLQHSMMARPAFKRLLTTVIPKAAERSTYVLLSGLLMLLYCLAWQALPGTIWELESSALRVTILGVQILGWLIVVIATSSINHFELMGLQQVYYNLIGKSEPPANFSERGLYCFVRHPIQLGLLVGIWCAPTMTTTHLMLSATMTLYILVALYFEEKDLVATLGEDYEDYRRRVPMLVPLLKWSRP